MEFTVIITVAASALLLLGMGAVLDDRRARRRRDEPPPPELRLLHSLNDDRCIGCEACIDVCPTEVLDLVNHKVQIARFQDCVQCEQCANACPTMALVMYREGSQPKMLTVPELDDKFQTGVPGQYLIGEVAGKPLVKNSANLGRAVVEHIRKELATEPAPAGVKDLYDVVVVGSGPAGLSAGLSCMKYGLKVLLLEKDHVISSTVSRYPKGKHFMAEPANAVNLSFLPVFDASKEDLVAAWQRVVEAVKMPIKLGEAVETVKRGDDGIFTTKSTVGTYKSRRVILATGLRGKPRLLIVPGANLEKVHSLLDDPDEFAGMHVLVVGGGDSAVEGALSLADTGATVTLSYRGDGFKRCKQGNQKRLAEYEGNGKVTSHLESNVKEFTATEVSIKLKSGETITIPNDHAFVLIGADTPVAWLEANNVRFIERPHLYALGSTEDVARRAAPDAIECANTPEAAIASVLGQGTPKPSRKRLTSVFDHLRHDLKDVVGEVSRVFTAQDVAGYAPRDTAREAHRGRTTRTPVAGVRTTGAVPTMGKRTGSAPVIPADRLARNKTGAVPTNRPSRPSDLWKDSTVVGLAPAPSLRMGDWSEPRTFVGPAPRSGTQTNATAPQRAIRQKTKAPTRAPTAGGSDGVPSKRVFDQTGSVSSLKFEDVIESAFERAFEPARASRSPTRANKVIGGEWDSGKTMVAPKRSGTDTTNVVGKISFEEAVDNALDNAFGEAGQATKPAARSRKAATPARGAGIVGRVPAGPDDRTTVGPAPNRRPPPAAAAAPVVGDVGDRTTVGPPPTSRLGAGFEQAERTTLSAPPSRREVSRAAPLPKPLAGIAPAPGAPAPAAADDFDGEGPTTAIEVEKL